MMTEYIEREAAYQAIEIACNGCLCEKTVAGSVCHDCSIMKAKSELQALPSADVRPVKRGKWQEWWPGDCALVMTGEEMLWMCSECTAKFSDKSAFCPNCGAMMEES